MCNACPNPVHCIMPPYILRQMAESSDDRIRSLAIDAIEAAAVYRTRRRVLASLPMMSAIPSPEGKKHRLVYDAKHREQLPGKLIRSEGQPKSKDLAVNEAFDHSGIVYDFYQHVFGRNSLDGRGMSLISSVHLGKLYNNAFWDGEQMAYGDGDGQLFVRFTKALDVVGHELSHGVVTHTANLEYRDEPGALNEHFADVMGEMTAQWHKKEDCSMADWLVGAEIMGPATKAKGLRSFKQAPAFVDDPVLGTDPQPKHLKDKYKGQEDHGGVHINSGIPNHAFYLVCMALGGNSWDKAGPIWYHTLRRLGSRSDFADMQRETTSSAIILFGHGSLEVKAVEKAWKSVGF